ncbi:MAG: hypothetical protein OXI16_12625 [Chloroflexota bacterium]|nr:hypothetical protein [Chloroflexota bacterium]
MSIGAGGVTVFGGIRTTVAVSACASEIAGVVGRAMGWFAGGVVLHAANPVQEKRITAVTRM